MRPASSPSLTFSTTQCLSCRTKQYSENALLNDSYALNSLRASLSLVLQSISSANGSPRIETMLLDRTFRPWAFTLSEEGLGNLKGPSTAGGCSLSESVSASASFTDLSCLFLKNITHNNRDNGNNCNNVDNTTIILLSKN